MEYIDLLYALREIKPWEDSKIQKIHQHKDTFVLELFKRGTGKTFLVLKIPEAIYLSDQKPAIGAISAFGTRLRKMWSGGILRLIDVLPSERIVHLVVSAKESYNVYVELFGKGNVIICDPKKQIVLPWRSQSFTARTLKRGKQYETPPSREDVSTMDDQAFYALLHDVKKNISTTLAKAGLGRKYAHEACVRAEINPQATHLSPTEQRALYTVIQTILHGASDPYILLEDGAIVDVAPFKMESILSEHKSVDRFSDALAEIVTWERPQSAAEKQVAKIKTIIQEQQKTVAQLKQQMTEETRKAEALYTHYAMVQEILQKAREGTVAGYPAVKQIDRKRKTVTLELE